MSERLKFAGASLEPKPSSELQDQTSRIKNRKQRVTSSHIRSHNQESGCVGVCSLLWIKKTQQSPHVQPFKANHRMTPRVSRVLFDLGLLLGRFLGCLGHLQQLQEFHLPAASAANSQWRWLSQVRQNAPALPQPFNSSFSLSGSMINVWTCLDSGAMFLTEEKLEPPANSATPIVRSGEVNQMC